MPKILSNTPIGEDYLKSGSHEIIAKTIIEIIQKDIQAEKNDKLDKKIIGLEGDWGSGKSNIIKILESKVDENKLNFHHFLFDTWTHQEDINRKSLLDELISYLKIKEKITEKNESEKYSRLYQKEIKKNTKSNPIYKSYYILWALSFLIMSFGNIIYRERVNERIFRGFYDDSFRYLIENFKFNHLFFLFPDLSLINYIYLLKLLPYILILIGLYKFLKDLVFLLQQNKNVNEVFSELFSFSKGESNNKLSVEFIQEVETNNRAFKTFLKNEIDCLFKEEILIITFDNVDRLSDEKVKNIWSMIYIFFAEDNDLTKNLKNIWLIVPYDENKISEAFGGNSEIARSLLDKTFSFTFRVPPPLTSNWEINIFEKLIKKAFYDVKIDDDEINLLTRILGEYSERINPRKIINFINDLVTYYHLNNQIKLRYVALFNLNKAKILNSESINANIIGRQYLGSLVSYFESDNSLDINIAKIVYGVKTDEEAYECLLSKDINDILSDISSEKSISDYIKIPLFNKHFTKVFNEYVWRVSKESLDLIRISNILLEIEFDNLKESEKLFFNKCWDNLGSQILNQPDILLKCYLQNSYEFPKLKNEKSLIDNIIYYSTQKSLKEMLNIIIEYIDKNSTENSKYKPKDYCHLLFIIKTSLNSNSKLRINNLKLNKRIIDSKLFVEVVSQYGDINDLKIVVNSDELNKYFTGEDEVFEDVSFSRINENLNLIKILYKSKNYDFNILTKFLVTRINGGKVKNINEFNLFIELISLFSNEELLKLNIKNSYERYISIFSDEKNFNNLQLYSLLIVNFHRNFSLTNSDRQANRIISLLDVSTFEIKEISEKVLKFISISEVIKIPLQIKNIKLNNLNLVVQSIFETQKFDDKDVNWIFQNFTDIKETIYCENNQDLIELLQNKYSKFNFDIQDVDLEIMNLNSVFENKMVKKAKNYLLINHQNFEKNIRSETFYLRLLKKLIEINALDEKYFNEDFYNSYKNILLKSNLNNFYFNIINKLKKYMNSKKIEEISKEALLTRNITASSTKFIEYIYPEVNNFIEEPQFLNKKQIVNNIKRKLRLN
jgi:hypothetical protein